MVHAQVTKSSAYYSRFQVKYRRRRQGKTDYRARLRLCTQDRNKYNTPKYRLIVRFTNKDIIAQVAYATLAGDVVVSAAYAHQLSDYGLPVGHTNYAAAYAVGLLIARRTLAKFGLAEAYEGNTEELGDDYNVEANDEGPRPFACVLDTGIKRTSTGSKVFAVLKGALDGGLDIPHSDKRFVGYDAEKKEVETDVLREHIMGTHVAEYMTEMQEEEPEQFQSVFSGYIKKGITGEDYEEAVEKTHEAIRERPVHEKKQRSKPSEAKRWKPVKLTYDERKASLKTRLAALAAEDDE